MRARMLEASKVYPVTPTSVTPRRSLNHPLPVADPDKDSSSDFLVPLAASLFSSSSSAPSFESPSSDSSSSDTSTPDFSGGGGDFGGGGASGDF